MVQNTMLGYGQNNTEGNMKTVETIKLNENLTITEIAHKTDINGNVKKQYLVTYVGYMDDDKTTHDSFLIWGYDWNTRQDLKQIALKALKSYFNISGEGYREYEIMSNSERICDWVEKGNQYIKFTKLTQSNYNDYCIYNSTTKTWVN